MKTEKPDCSCLDCVAVRCRISPWLNKVFSRIERRVILYHRLTLQIMERDPWNAHTRWTPFCGQRTGFDTFVLEPSPLSYTTVRSPPLTLNRSRGLIWATLPPEHPHCSFMTSRCLSAVEEVFSDDSLLLLLKKKHKYKTREIHRKAFAKKSIRRIKTIRLR